jgi:hypothetical protein
MSFVTTSFLLQTLQDTLGTIPLDQSNIATQGGKSFGVCPVVFGGSPFSGRFSLNEH